MDMRKYAGSSSFIHIEDVPTPHEVTIIKIIEGKYDKPDLLFDTGEKLSLNATNVKTLMAASGPNSKDWLNMTIELRAGLTKFQGKDQDSVLVRPISPAKPKAEWTPLPAEPGFDDQIPF